MFLLGFLAVPLIIVGAQEEHCDPTYTASTTSDGATKCYKVIYEKVTFKDAEERCKKEGAQLPSVHNADENRAIISLYAAYYTEEGFIGLVRDGPSWSFSDGSPFDYHNWKEGEPNNQKDFSDGDKDFTVDEGENCVTTTRSGWLDVPCTFTYPFMCQKDPSS